MNNNNLFENVDLSSTRNRKFNFEKEKKKGFYLSTVGNTLLKQYA